MKNPAGLSFISSGMKTTKVDPYAEENEEGMDSGDEDIDNGGMYDDMGDDMPDDSDDGIDDGGDMGDDFTASLDYFFH